MKKRMKVTLRLTKDGKEQAINTPNLVKQTFHLYEDQIEAVQSYQAATGFTYVHCLRNLLDLGIKANEKGVEGARS